MAEKSRKDWKFFVMLAVTVAGVLTPIWLTKFQSPDKRIVIRLVSQSELQPATKDAIPGLQLLVDGAVLSDPYLSVLQVVNEGNKPVSANDFEAPLEIHVGADRNIVRARVSERSPDDIQADVSWKKQIVQMKPILLNPNDSLTLAILSTGGAPTFVTRARIIGVSSVPVLKSEKGGMHPFLKALFLVGAFFFAVVSLASYWRWPVIAPPGTLVSLRPRTVLAIAALLQFGALGLLAIVLDAFGLNSYLVGIGAATALFAIATPFARLLEAHSKDATPEIKSRK